ncbi:dethiobiotin synthase [Kangiella sp. TOML190]|uniref:dethiobiotin synthase n=1 Tax=Kangiella sp. TOML190 TaxID=2931351 RepID=UPI0020415FF7|nr:dethiobiotin synthase [Kangiella sp. TOML190]
MTKTYFITGTDTEVGKTYVTALLIRALRVQGHKVVGLKPIASDSQNGQIREPETDELHHEGLINSDARALYLANQGTLAYEVVNPIRFAEPIAPHIAAQRLGQALSVAQLSEYFFAHKTQFDAADLCLIEGAGGWLTPLNQTETYADWVAELELSVILVVGMKLGCLNHAQLTYQAVEASGLKVVGWVANQLDPQMAYYDENLTWLKTNLPAPLLAEIGYQQSASQLDLEKLRLLF